MKSILYFFSISWLAAIAAIPAVAQRSPKKLLIYYAYPSVINGATTIAAAANEFAPYEYVVLGDGIELTGHPDRANTQAIMSQMATATTRFFGYVDLGVSTQNQPMSEIQNRINLWKAIGADGIFFDDFGYDYLVSRQRQNEAVAYAHAQGLPVVANGWNPDDVFGTSANSTYNPAGTVPALNGTDFYLSESYLITEGNFQNPADWKVKADKLRTYQLAIGFQILSITTNSTANTYDPAKFAYAWYGALLYGHVATGWGEIYFSAGNAQAPFRTRPTITQPGTVFRGEVETAANESFRYTDTGKIWLNTSVHTYGFTACGVCTSTGSGAWTSVSTWSNGRVPFPCDQVVVQPTHVITIPAKVNAAKTNLNGKLVYTNGGLLTLWP